MASKIVNLNQRCFFVLSGISNPLGKSLALEMCRRFKPGSLAVLIESSGEDLQELKKEIKFLENDVEVFCCNIGDWQDVNAELCHEMLQSALNVYSEAIFDIAFILHNEGKIATQSLMEPDVTESWKKFVQEHLYAAVALNREFLKLNRLQNMKKLVVGMSSSLMVKPLIYSSLMCSCLNARDMYFRAMAADEERHGVNVLTYSPGILDSHQSEFDVNNNMIDLLDVGVDEKLLKLPRVKPMQATLKLINILQEISFVSGHEIDFYVTFVL